MSLKLNERYPGRFNNPSADYPGGSYKNRTTPDAKDGSYLEKDWANDKEGFFQSVVAAMGAAPNGLVDKVGASQVFDCLLQLAQNQIAQAFTTSGTATALILTPVPAIAGYAPGQRFNVKFHVPSGANPTLNTSAKGAKALKQYTSAGTKVAASFVADQIADLVYDGTDWVVLDALPPSSSAAIRGGKSNLAITTTGLSTIAALSADEFVVKSSSGLATNLSNVNVTVNLSNVGAGGRDTGGLSGSLWYYAFIIYNPTTGDVAGIASSNSTAPLLPAGYTQYGLAGPLRTQASSPFNLLSSSQFNNDFKYEVVLGTNVTSFPAVTSGAATTAITVATSSVAPPIAKIGSFVCGTNSGFVAFAPAGGFVSTPGTNYLSTAQLNGFPFAGGWNASGPVPTASGEISLRNPSVMYASSTANGVIQCMGFRI